jgi:hypothetical protein
VTTSSDVKLNADNANLSFGSYARREMGKGEIRGLEHSAFLLLCLCLISILIYPIQYDD